MGDRCYFEVLVKNEHAERFLKLVLCGMADDTQESLNAAYYEDQQANYGNQDACETAAKEGLVFAGFHDAGSDYGAAKFFSNGDGTLYSFDVCRDRTGFLVDPINDEGDLNMEALTKLMKTYGDWHRLHKQLSR